MNCFEILASGSLFNKDVVVILRNMIARRKASTFRIRNYLEHDVTIECRKRRRSAGEKIIQPGEYYAVDIYPFAWTEWWCSLRLSENSKEVIKFLVHKGNENSHTFELRADGIYKMDLDGCNRYFYMDWPEQ